MVEWQTRRTQNPLMATSCGFKSRLRHQIKNRVYIYSVFYLPYTGPANRAKSGSQVCELRRKPDEITHAIFQTLNAETVSLLKRGQQYIRVIRYTAHKIKINRIFEIFLSSFYFYIRDYFRLEVKIFFLFIDFIHKFLKRLNYF